MVWEILSGQTVSHDPERTQGLSEFRRPETAGELMQLIQAINCPKSACATHVAPSAWRCAVLLVATSGRTNAWPRGMLCDYG